MPSWIGPQSSGPEDPRHRCRDPAGGGPVPRRSCRDHRGPVLRAGVRSLEWRLRPLVWRRSDCGDPVPGGRPGCRCGSRGPTLAVHAPGRRDSGPPRRWMWRRSVGRAARRSTRHAPHEHVAGRQQARREYELLQSEPLAGRGAGELEAMLHSSLGDRLAFAAPYDDSWYLFPGCHHEFQCGRQGWRSGAGTATAPS